ncbi:NUDIX domain-containing protein [Candidatus Saccharibacteria bacterium]|nr:NUDIX domain-containing protein [Candidatus Saccharibacteria bacterium]
MPHIHTQPNQHDMTVSAYIIRHEDDEWKCLVHMHKKIDKLMQIGGHIELDQTPWQALVDELREESGYMLEELELLQPYENVPQVGDAVVHPLPFLSNTHDVGDGHYHSDACYGFIAYTEPKNSPSESESSDIRWLSRKELESAAKKGILLEDTADMYYFLLDNLESFHHVDPMKFSLEKPQKGITYKR